MSIAIDHVGILAAPAAAAARIELFSTDGLLNPVNSVGCAPDQLIIQQVHQVAGAGTTGSRHDQRNLWVADHAHDAVRSPPRAARLNGCPPSCDLAM